MMDGPMFKTCSTCGCQYIVFPRGVDHGLCSWCWTECVDAMEDHEVYDKEDI
jgi:hypothetical protein